MSIFSQLPNNLIMDIIRMADGGLQTHKKKLHVILQQFRNEIPIYEYEDGAGNTDCPMYIWEQFDGARSESEEEEEDDY